MVTRVRRLASLALALLVLAGARPALAEARVRLVAPATGVGDGETKLIVKLVGVSALTTVRFDAEAGTFGEVRAVHDGIEVDFVPPRIAQAREVHIVATGVRVAPAVIALQPRATAAEALVSTGPFVMTAPRALRLGQDTAMTITLRATTPPILSTNVGSVSAPIAAGAGAWRFEYRPPAQRFPQVAILAAIDSAGQIDWLPLPLHGVGRVETRTKPHARITLQFGASTFGPFRTDGTGFAVNAVVAPPGLHRGTVDAVDALGNAKQTPFELGTPPFSRVLAVCANDRVHVFVANEEGAPLAGTSDVRVDAARGLVASLTRVGAGHFVTQWEPRSDESRTDAEVFATLPGEAVSRSSCVAHAAEAEPSALELVADRATYVAGSGALRVTARFRYASARGGRVVPVVFTSDDGAVTSNGALVAEWRVADRFGNKRQATIRAKTTGTPALEATLSVALIGGTLQTIAVAAPRGWHTADGTTRVRVTAQGRDSFGNPTALGNVDASAHGGPIPIEPTDDPSTAQLAYTPPRGRRASSDAIQVSTPNATGSVTLALHAPPPAITLAAHIGYLTNFGKVAGPIAWLDADWHPRGVGRRFALGLRAGVYHAELVDDRPNDVSLTALNVPVLARVGVALVQKRFGASLGVGGGALVTRLATDAGGTTSLRTSVLGAFEAHVGGDVDVGFGRLTLEAAYLYAPQKDGAITGNFGGLGVTLGYRVGL